MDNSTLKNETSQFCPVILCGGAGSRLWPLSRSAYPKQFLDLTSDKTCLVETIERIAGVTGASHPLFLSNEEHRFLVAAQAQTATDKIELILEPAGRNTAPAIALAALHLTAQGRGEEVMTVLPADHAIKDGPAFRAAIAQAIETAKAGWLVAFGIAPSEPHTGYGYIKMSGITEGSGAERIERFVEKPNLEAAKAYLDEGTYRWNSGMFAMRADQYLEELAQHAPDILASCKTAMAHAQVDQDFVRPEEQAFLSCRSESIDYAVMEHSTRAAVVPCDIGWSDIGSWTQLREISDKDGQGNSLVGDTMIEDVSNSYIRSDDDRLVAVMGLDNVTVVSTTDAVLVVANDRSQDVKRFVERLKADDRPEWDTHTRVYRPWGFYEGIHLGDRHQVKHISVKPGATLSLQKHFHRSEHWVVVRGTAIVTRDDEEIMLTENKSVYLPLGCVHRLTNPGKVALSIIEVQTGSYLGEDDIVRLEDIYHRV